MGAQPDIRYSSNSDLFTNAALPSQEKGIPWTSRESLPGLTHRDRQPSMLAEMETQKPFLLSDDTFLNCICKQWFVERTESLGLSIHLLQQKQNIVKIMHLLRFVIGDTKLCIHTY